MALSSLARLALDTALANPGVSKEVRENLDVLSGNVADVEFTVGAPHTSAVNVALQLKDANGNDVTSRKAIVLFLLADANGDAFSTVDLDSVAIGTDGALLDLVTDKAWLAISEADGDIDITFTEATATGTVYLAALLPGGKLAISGAITFT